MTCGKRFLAACRTESRAPGLGAHACSHLAGRKTDFAGRLVRSSPRRLGCLLAGWPVSWLAGWLVGWLANRLVGRRVGYLARRPGWWAGGLVGRCKGEAARGVIGSPRTPGGRERLFGVASVLVVCFPSLFANASTSSRPHVVQDLHGPIRSVARGHVLA